MNVTKSLIKEYIKYLQIKGTQKDVTIAKNIRNLKPFLNYCMHEDQEYITKFEIEVPKFDEVIPITFSTEQLSVLMRKPDIKKGRNIIEFRNWLMSAHMFDTGNRISTIINIKIADLHLEEYYIELQHTKNRKKKMQPISQELCLHIREFLRYRGGDYKDYLYCSQFGKQLTRSGAYQSLKKYNISRGISMVKPHAYRYSFAENFLLQSDDIYALKELLGHSNLSMVLKYLRAFNKNLQPIVEQTSPLKKYMETKRKVLK